MHLTCYQADKPNLDVSKSSPEPEPIGMTELSSMYKLLLLVHLSRSTFCCASCSSSSFCCVISYLFTKTAGLMSIGSCRYQCHYAALYACAYSFMATKRCMWSDTASMMHNSTHSRPEQDMRQPPQSSHNRACLTVCQLLLEDWATCHMQHWKRFWLARTRTEAAEADLMWGMVNWYTREQAYLHSPHLKRCPLDAAVLPADMRLYVAMVVYLEVEDSIHSLFIGCLTLSLPTCGMRVT